MRKFILFSLLIGLYSHAQQKVYEEYSLSNGLEVILYPVEEVPVVAIGMNYHVGAKDEVEGKTGMAHFFEHLLFEGSENIGRGEFFKIVNLRGGTNNAFTTQDQTYYFESFPAHELKLGLWLEAERMGHPKIDSIGVKTQNEVVKEEKRTRIDNAPYAKIYYGEINKFLFKNHPYKHSVIGSMEDLDSQTLEDFMAFREKWYQPANATLVVSGNFKINEAKKWIEDYFGDIRSQAVPEKTKAIEAPLEAGKATVYDANINKPALVLNYRYGKNTSDEAYQMEIISEVLSNGETSRLYQRLVEKDKLALKLYAYPQSMEDYGIYRIMAIPRDGVSLEKLHLAIQEEIQKLQAEGIKKREHEKVLNHLERAHLQSKLDMGNLARLLATFHDLYGNTSLIDTQIERFRSYSTTSLQQAAKNILAESHCFVIHYLPKNEKE